MTNEATTPSSGYGPAMALRHLVAGVVAPGDATREALSSGIGECARLALFGLFVLCLGIVEPETRSLARAAIENALDDQSRSVGLAFLGFGIVAIGIVLVGGYWLVACVALAMTRTSWSRVNLARMRSVVALGAWLSLLPTLAVKVAALAFLSPGQVAADPPSLYSAIEVAMSVPYFAACLGAAFSLALPRAVTTAIVVNATFYLVVIALYLTVPSE